MLKGYQSTASSLSGIVDNMSKAINVISTVVPVIDSLLKKPATKGNLQSSGTLEGIFPSLNELIPAVQNLLPIVNNLVPLLKNASPSIKPSLRNFFNE